jgi:CheY-like chemotaxis protein
MDWKMPGMNGLDTLAGIAPMRPASMRRPPASWSRPSIAKRCWKRHASATCRSMAS